MDGFRGQSVGLPNNNFTRGRPARGKINEKGIHDEMQKCKYVKSYALQQCLVSPLQVSPIKFQY